MLSIKQEDKICLPPKTEDLLMHESDLVWLGLLDRKIHRHTTAVNYAPEVRISSDIVIKFLILNTA